MTDPYRKLYVQPDAPQEVIEAAHRALVKLHHPDIAGPGATTRMAAINAAYDKLRDPNRRPPAPPPAPPPAARVRMPFGKHKDAELAAVPTDYLRWLLDWDGLRPGLRRDVQAVLDWRAA